MKVRRKITKEPQTLSVCMIAQNSAHCIGRALESVQDICDEIIVVDGGSNDDTTKIAESFEKVKIINHPWPGNFGFQKNMSMEKASGDWIFILDSDEAIGANMRKKIRKLISSARHDCYIFPRYWVAGMQPLSYIKSEKLYPDYQQRLFRNLPKYRYTDERAVHHKFPEGVQEIGKKVKKAHIFHFDLMHNDRRAREEKARKYFSLDPRGSHTSHTHYLFEDYPHKIKKCREKL